MGQMAQGPSVHETDDDAEFVMSKMLRPSLERSSEALARDMTQLYYSSGHSSNHHVSARSLDKKGEEVSTLKAYIDSHFSEPALKSFKGPLKALLNSGFSEYSIAKESLIGNAVVKRSPMTDDAVNEDELKLAKTHAKMISSSIRVQFSHHLKVKLHEWADSEKKAIKEIKNQHKKLKEKKWLR